MGDAHVPRQIDDPLAVLKDTRRHAIALALEYPAAMRTGGNAAGILATVLEVVKTLVEVDGRFGARRVGEDETENAAHVAGLVGSHHTDDWMVSKVGSGSRKGPGRSEQHKQLKTQQRLPNGRCSVEGIQSVDCGELPKSVSPLDTRRRARCTIGRGEGVGKKGRGQARITGYSPPRQEGQGQKAVARTTC